MKKKTLLVGLLAILICFTLAMTACGAETLSSWTAPTYSAAVTGEEITLTALEVETSSGNKITATVTVADPNGDAVTVTDGKFTPSVVGDYTITYAITFDDETATKTATLTVAEDIDGAKVAYIANVDAKVAELIALDMYDETAIASLEAIADTAETAINSATTIADMATISETAITDLEAVGTSIKATQTAAYTSIAAAISKLEDTDTYLSDDIDSMTSIGNIASSSIAKAETLTAIADYLEDAISDIKAVESTLSAYIASSTAKINGALDAAKDETGYFDDEITALETYASEAIASIAGLTSSKNIDTIVDDTVDYLEDYEPIMASYNDLLEDYIATKIKTCLYTLSDQAEMNVIAGIAASGIGSATTYTDAVGLIETAYADIDAITASGGQWGEPDSSWTSINATNNIYGETDISITDYVGEWAPVERAITIAETANTLKFSFYDNTGGVDNLVLILRAGAYSYNDGGWWNTYEYSSFSSANIYTPEAYTADENGLITIELDITEAVAWFYEDDEELGENFRINGIEESMAGIKFVIFPESHGSYRSDTDQTLDMSVVEVSTYYENKLDSWSAPSYSDQTLVINNAIEVTALTVDDSDGNTYTATTVVKDADGNEITVSDGKFTPTVSGDYTIDYTITFNDEDITKTRTITVLDKMLNEWSAPTLINGIIDTAYTFDTVAVTDTEGTSYTAIPVSASYRASGPNATTVSFDITGSGTDNVIYTGTPTSTGTYTVTYSVTFDGDAYTQTTTFVVVSANELQSWSAPADSTTSVGTSTTITSISVDDLLGNTYSAVITVADADGNAVDTTEDGGKTAFTPSAMGEYTVTYTITFGGEAYTQTTTITAEADNFDQYIILSWTKIAGEANEYGEATISSTGVAYAYAQIERLMPTITADTTTITITLINDGSLDNLAINLRGNWAGYDANGYDSFYEESYGDLLASATTDENGITTITIDVTEAVAYFYGDAETLIGTGSNALRLALFPESYDTYYDSSNTFSFDIVSVVTD